MLTSPNDVVAFRSSHGTILLCFALAVLLFGMAFVGVAASLDERETGSLFVAFACGCFGLLAIWSGIYHIVKRTTVGPDGIAVRKLSGTSRFEWRHISNWRMDEDQLNVDGQVIRPQQLSIGFQGLPWYRKTWIYFEVARPGFDQFLELFRRYAAEKEEPGHRKAAAG